MKTLITVPSFLPEDAAARDWRKRYIASFSKLSSKYDILVVLMNGREGDADLWVQAGVKVIRIEPALPCLLARTIMNRLAHLARYDRVLWIDDDFEIRDGALEAVEDCERVGSIFPVWLWGTRGSASLVTSTLAKKHMVFGCAHLIDTSIQLSPNHHRAIDEGTKIWKIGGWKETFYEREGIYMRPIDLFDGYDCMAREYPVDVYHSRLTSGPDSGMITYLAYRYGLHIVKTPYLRHDYYTTDQKRCEGRPNYSTIWGATSASPSATSFKQPQPELMRTRMLRLIEAVDQSDRFHHARSWICTGQQMNCGWYGHLLVDVSEFL